MRHFTWAGNAFALLLAIFVLLSVGQVFGHLGIFFSNQIHVAIALAGALVCIYLIPGAEKVERSKLDWVVGFIMAAAALYALSFVVFSYDRILFFSMTGRLDQEGIIAGGLLVIALLESVRRKTGVILPLIIIALVSIVIFQNYMPGILYGRGYSIDRVLFSSMVGGHGIFGLPLQVAVETILSFVIVGTLISASGAGGWFLDLALTLTGRRRGGPAKAAVVASAMFGSISGSPSANAASTGMLTIPMMIKLGYQPKFAAGVEAVASPSGLILPPVMGAIAFVMAEWIGVSYSTIVVAAIIPAMLYIAIIYASVHFQAMRDDLQPVPDKDLPKLGSTLRRGWFFPVPLVALCLFLFAFGFPPGMSAVMSMPFAIAVSFLNPDRSCWLGPRKLAQALIDSVHTWKGIAAITAAVGIMVGALDLSGVGLNISSFLIELSGGNLLITLVMIGVAALVLGMGLDAIPAYVTLATILAPALVMLGVPEIGAHLYVIYWGLASFFTPPTCLAVFITCSISGSRIWETGWEAVKLGLGAFLIPIAFALEPALLMRGSLIEIVLSTGTALVGAGFLAAGVRGYSLYRLGWPARVLSIVGGVLMIYPDAVVSASGALLAIATLTPWILAKVRGRQAVVVNQ
ncbi:MAG: TRAP transporter fused permease subunit [Natronospirillum sp.]